MDTVETAVRQAAIKSLAGVVKEEDFEKLTTPKLRLLEELARSYGVITTACKRAGICRERFYEWGKKDELFRKYAAEIIDSQIEVVESKLLELIENNNPTAIIYYLKTKGRDRGWNERYWFTINHIKHHLIGRYVKQGEESDLGVE